MSRFPVAVLFPLKLPSSLRVYGLGERLWLSAFACWIHQAAVVPKETGQDV